ncbi:hypothetical protein ACFYT3_05440 [Nocardia amikacinitolerans]|uniref:hypothetical protein n=1 Tax=Nocardia amikacinitolerans TaxID=756689 RepID=UPI0036D053CD
MLAKQFPEFTPKDHGHAKFGRFVTASSLFECAKSARAKGKPMVTYAHLPDHRPRLLPHLRLARRRDRLRRHRHGHHDDGPRRPQHTHPGAQSCKDNAVPWLPVIESIDAGS